MINRGTIQSLARDPLVWTSLAIRVALLFWAISQGNWQLGDTAYYLRSAAHVCQGEWGGDLSRTPLYSWFLCGFSGGSSFLGPVGLALIVQSLLSWVIGIWISRGPTPLHRTAALIFLFDPVLLVYSQLVMSDSIFMVLVFFLALQLNRIFLRGRATTFLDEVTLGFLSAAVILQRPIGEPLVGITILFLLGVTFLKKLRVRAVLIPSLVIATFLFPRIYWVHAHNGNWSLAEEGSNLLYDTAGVVENYGFNLDFQQSEEKWFRDHSPPAQSDALKSIEKRLPTLAFLSVKGITRSLFGHVNIEWAYFLTGKAVTGPGWFKIKDHSADASGGIQVEGFFKTLLWCAGILGTLFFAIWEYRLFWRRTQVTQELSPIFRNWVLSASMTLAAAPEVYGDARFRAPVLAILIAALICRSAKKPDPA